MRIVNKFSPVLHYSNLLADNLGVTNCIEKNTFIFNLITKNCKYDSSVRISDEKLDE